MSFTMSTEKSYPISTKSRTYFAKVNEQIEIVYEFYYGEKLRDGNKIESVSGTSKAFMNKNFTLICEIGDSPEVRWYIRSTGLLLAKFVNCEKVPGSIQRLHSPVRISCNLISQKSTLELGPVNLKDGNFTIVCATKHHGSEFKVSTIDSRNLTIHDAGTITVTGENIATLLCPLEEGDTLSVWKGNGTVIEKSYSFTIPGRTYFAHVNGNVIVSCSFYDGDFLQQWVENGPIASCNEVHPLNHDGYKIEEVTCKGNVASMKVTLLKIKTLNFICYSNACVNTNLTLLPLYNDAGNLKPVGGTKPRMQKEFRLNCNIGSSPDVTWYYENGDVLMKYRDCTEIGGNSSRFAGRAQFTCEPVQKRSILTFVPILLKDGNFSIICMTNFHGSEYNIRTVGL
ncbi:Hypothetical predicted protein [Octopus vulgaris]|uniref:Uncharacterized protein n=1 Tax=Octopus vulgaris TaxID=6645 RepID=A0AA36F2H3_OCTVU|nr:Hypothetical predicted protein [Octopus vulgaris]